MSLYKKAIRREEGLNERTISYTLEVDTRSSNISKGVAGDKLKEPVPNYISTPCEKVISNSNNAFIVLGRDRPGSRMSGYGGSGDTQAASIDMVVGRMGRDAREADENGEQIFVDPNFKTDSARIYISQKTDVDKNFDIVSGKVGNSIAKSAVAIKADGVRIIAREGIKLITRTDINNSQGGEVKVIGGIDLIAGNDDSDMQPIPKGNNLQKALGRIVHHIDKLTSIVDSFLMIQMKMNEATTQHYHYSPFFAAPTTPAIDVLVPEGIMTLIDQLVKVKLGVMGLKMNLIGLKVNYLSPVGKKYINSRYNNTN